MDFDLPKEITDKLADLDAFIETEIKPLERENMQFFDHRREHARTDWDRDGRPRDEWRALISEMERRADKAGHLRYGLPKSCGGSGCLQSRRLPRSANISPPRVSASITTSRTNSSIVGNFPIIPALADYGTRNRNPISKASSPARNTSLSG